MRLLLVEDEIEYAENLKKKLETKGFVTDWLEDGEKARSRILLYRNDYDVIVLDLRVPGMDGMTLTKSLRSYDITTPIIVITGQSATEYKIEMLNSGADDYVVKPFAPEELIARINSVLRRAPENRRSGVRVVGDITIDIAAHRVYSGSQEVSLTLKEYTLLECFSRRPGEVLTREEIANKIWDFNAVTLSNVLDVHMKNLRNKLRRSKSSTSFQTVRGIGYRLVQ